MINVIKSDERAVREFGWLTARWHFSFSDYRDPANVRWGALRVFNDDVIHGGGGFDFHPHRDMEIVTVVLDGALEHRDHLGNRGVVRPGEVQVMSAGAGIVHAEHNASATEDVRLLQLWILPRERGRKPRWEQRAFDGEARRGRLLPVVSDGGVPGTLAIDQDAAIFLASLAAGQEVRHDLRGPGRKAYLFVMAGAAEVNGTRLSAGDQGRIADEPSLAIRATEEGAELILLDLPEVEA